MKNIRTANYHIMGSEIMRKTANTCLLLRGVYYVTLTATRGDERRDETSR